MSSILAVSLHFAVLLGWVLCDSFYCLVAMGSIGNSDVGVNTKILLHNRQHIFL